MSDFFSNLKSITSQLLQRAAECISWLITWLGDNQASLGDWYIGLMRWVMPFLALSILLSVLVDMFRVKTPKEMWGTLAAPGWGDFPIRQWECILGRAKHCDVRVNYPTVSRSQCALIRNAEGNWCVHNLSEKNKTLVNDTPVENSKWIHMGDVISFGGVSMRFTPLSGEDPSAVSAMGGKLKKIRPLARWRSLFLLTLFQISAAAELAVTRSEEAPAIFMCFASLIGIMWGYVLFNRAAGVSGFEPEIIAFFTCTMSLAVTASASTSALLTQTCSIALGVLFFLVLGWFLRDLDRVVKTRHLAAGAGVVLLLINLLFGSVHHGAMNWISVAGISVQPSELVKVCFIFAGAATLERLFTKRNIGGFILLSGFCMGCLAIMSDFGTALIFFVTFLVIAFLRSGDFATLALICCGAVAAVAMILCFKPYIASRFSVWGHAWEYPNDAGFQQVRTMSAAASGGMIGTGPGKGWLSQVFASDTDLVFGMLCEEWGLVIALLTLAGIVALSIFAVRVTRSGRSSYYTIAACAATSLLVFQTMLHVFGSVDLLPLTGVTFPFLSKGGSSMIACWGLLAFVKAADIRQNASFAVRTTGVDEELQPERNGFGVEEQMTSKAEKTGNTVLENRENEFPKDGADEEVRNFAQLFDTDERLTDFSQLDDPEKSDHEKVKASREIRDFMPFTLDIPENGKKTEKNVSGDEDDMDAFFRQFEETDENQEGRK